MNEEFKESAPAGGKRWGDRAGHLPLVELREVTLLADGRRMFPRTSWAILPAEHWAIVGPNGSGKSVLARALWDGVHAVEGEIAFPLAESEAAGGRTGVSAHAHEVRHVCFDDQRARLTRDSRYLQGRYESLEDDGAPTVADLLATPGQELQRPRAGQVSRGMPAACELLESLGLTHTLGGAVCRLSNGEMRKVLVAEALMSRPRLLVLEEPLQGLDRSSRREMRRLFHRVAGLGVTLVIVTSREADIPALVTRVIRVRDGSVVSRGPRRIQCRRPLHLPYPVATLHPPPVRARRGQEHRPGGKRTSGPTIPIVEMRNVTVRWGGTTVLDRVSWTVRQGEGWALVGPNGAGKTTLLSLILADNPQAYANDVRLFGRQRGDGQSIWEIKALMGHVSPEIQAHHPAGATVFETILSDLCGNPAACRACTGAERAAACEWAAALDLVVVLDKEFGRVSDGQKRLALIARAMVKAPRLLVLDEPCQGLDDGHRANVLAIVDALARQGTMSIIFVTHEPREIPRSIRSRLALDRGRVRRCTRRGAPSRGLPATGREIPAACASRT